MNYSIEQGNFIKMHKANGKGKAILQEAEAPTFGLDNRLTDGGKVVSPTRRPPFTPQEYSWYSFLLEAESTLGS
jgi:hypothetical protein